jgi:3-hydroxyisobutyrate dehydrogenase-like beta-hydroxyacid dehydrogenase
MKVGFIGLGVMGGPMALNILKGGHDLMVFDLNPEAVAQLTDAGARRPPRRARSAPRARSS